MLVSSKTLTKIHLKRQPYTYPIQRRSPVTRCSPQDILPMFFDVYVNMMCTGDDSCITPLTRFPDYQEQIEILRQMSFIATEVTDISKVQATVFKLLLDHDYTTLDKLLGNMKEYNRLVEDIRDIVNGEVPIRS